MLFWPKPEIAVCPGTAAAAWDVPALAPAQSPGISDRASSPTMLLSHRGKQEHSLAEAHSVNCAPGGEEGPRVPDSILPRAPHVLTQPGAGGDARVGPGRHLPWIHVCSAGSSNARRSLELAHARLHCQGLTRGFELQP